VGSIQNKLNNFL